MCSNPLLEFSWWGLTLQLAGAFVITGFVAAALVTLSLGRGVLQARLRVAEGVIGGLRVMTASTLLRTIGLRTWHQILIFTAWRESAQPVGGQQVFLNLFQNLL